MKQRKQLLFIFFLPKHFPPLSILRLVGSKIWNWGKIQEKLVFSPSQFYKEKTFLFLKLICLFPLIAPFSQSDLNSVLECLWLKNCLKKRNCRKNFFFLLCEIDWRKKFCQLKKHVSLEVFFPEWQVEK